MKLLDILKEQIDFRTYEGMVQVIYDNTENVANLAELLRALPGVTTVTNAGSSAEMQTMTFKIKLITQNSRSIDIALILNVSNTIEFGAGLSIPFLLNRY